MILLLSDDLLDTSKTTASARALGIRVHQSHSVADAIKRLELNSVACCIVDLQLPQLDLPQLLAGVARQESPCRVVAYGSHVDAERLKAARQLGCYEVMPRSQFFEEMPTRIAEWGGSPPVG